MVQGVELATTSSADPALLALEEKVYQLIVEKGDDEAALRTYAQAARSNPDNSYYRDQFLLLRRVIKIQETLKTETDAEKWKSHAQALRAYYYTKGDYETALVLDQKAYKKFKDTVCGAQLLETLLLRRVFCGYTVLHCFGGDGKLCTAVSHVYACT